jgi:hypothetical protein
MCVIRSLLFVVVLTSVGQGATPIAVISIQLQKPPGYLTRIAIVAVDGRAFKVPQRRVTVSPGNHSVSVRTWFILGPHKGDADASFTQTFEARPYTLEGGLSEKGIFSLKVVDETKRAHSK